MVGVRLQIFLLSKKQSLTRALCMVHAECPQVDYKQRAVPIFWQSQIQCPI